MPKELMVLPEEVLASGKIELGTIPINTYNRSLAEELSSNPEVTPERCLRLYRDMVLIREFETMLSGIRTEGRYRDITGTHLGPAHLSIGQEAAAVGMAYHLTIDDHIFGGGRSHGEFITKSLRVALGLESARLTAILESISGGAVLRIVTEHEPDFTPLRIAHRMKGKKAKTFVTDEQEEMTVDFVLYGLLAEIFGRENGLNKGMGGSMHAFLPHFGIYPNNAIVGGSAGLATGAALFKKINRLPGITVANIGDSSLGCGLVWEAMGFSSMGQFSNLWSEEFHGGLPIIFCIADNFYGMSGQPVGETLGFDRVARAGAGINPYNLHAECVDGNNPLAVADAFQRKMQVIKEKKGPVLLDILCYRQTGHSPTDQSAYRTREEIEAWRKVDPILQFGQQMVACGLTSPGDLEVFADYARRKVSKACRLALDPVISPRMSLSARTGLSELILSNRSSEPTAAPGRAEVLIPLEENNRVKAIAKKSRKATDAVGNKLNFREAVTYQDALFEAVIHQLYHEPRAVAYGEENREWGGAFGVYGGLAQSIPRHRLFNTPISEAAIVSSAVGYALEGGRPIVEIMFCDFLGRAADELFNQLAKWQAMSGGYFTMPVVVRLSVGSTYGAQHSQDWTSLCAHVPGLKVAFPATPYDAKGMLTSALQGSDPVLFFESQQLYNQTETFRAEGVPAASYAIPLGIPAIVKAGTDLTLLTFGATLYRAWDAAQRLEREFGVSVELIDGRCLVPFDYEVLVASVRKTGALMLGSDACVRGSFLNTIAADISQIAFDYLDAPVCVVGPPNWIVPPAELTKYFYPQPETFIDTYHTQIRPLPGHTPGPCRTAEEIVRLSKVGG